MTAFYDPDLAAVVINELNCFLERNFVLREFALTEPMFDCRIYQRGAQWHWQVMNDFEHVLASGVAESDQAARNAAVLQCLQRLGNRSGPN